MSAVTAPCPSCGKSMRHYGVPEDFKGYDCLTCVRARIDPDDKLEIPLFLRRPKNIVEPS